MTPEEEELVSLRALRDNILWNKKAYDNLEIPEYATQSGFEDSYRRGWLAQALESLAQHALRSK